MAKPTAEEFVAALRQVEEAGNVDAMAALYAPEARISNPLEREPRTGPDGARQFWGAYRDSFQKVHSRFHMILENEQGAILEWTSEVRTRAGVETTYDGVSVFEARDGQITRFVAYFDPAEIAAPAGGPPRGQGRADAYGTQPPSVDSSEVAAGAEGRR